MVLQRPPAGLAVVKASLNIQKRQNFTRVQPQFQAHSFTVIYLKYQLQTKTAKKTEALT